MSVYRVPPVRCGWLSRYFHTTQFSILGDANPGLLTWSAANRAIYMPFVVDHPLTITKLWWINGSGGATDTISAALYDLAGNRLTTTGSTARGTASAVQTVDIADLTLAVGRYWIGLSCSAATANNFIGGTAINNSRAREAGWTQQATAHPLPATITHATYASGSAPFFGFDTSWTAPA